MKQIILIKEIKKDFDCHVSVLHFPAQAGEALDNEVLHLGSWQYLQHNSLSSSVDYLISILFIYFYIFGWFRFLLEYFGSYLQSTSIPLNFFTEMAKTNLPPELSGELSNTISGQRYY